MVTTPHRSEVRIYYDMLVSLLEGSSQKIVSYIARRSNQSHEVADKRLRTLEEAGLVRLEAQKDCKEYAITEKGIRFIKEFEKFQSFIQGLGLLLRI